MTFLYPVFYLLPFLVSSVNAVKHPGDELFLRKRAPPEGYTNPLSSGGSFLTQVPDTSPEGLHEPINIILSANSESLVLNDSLDNGGLRNYFLSLGFSEECLGQHLGDSQKADLGDGKGAVNETAVIRYNYGDQQLGACTESVKGGNHFRYWTQNGTSANTGAIFMAVSYEKSKDEFHDIIFNGYNLGRDYLLGNITQSAIPTSSLTSGQTFSGNTSNANYTYTTNILFQGGLLNKTSDGINHFATVGNDQTPAVDGLVAILTVTVPVKAPAGSNGNSNASPSAALQDKPQLLLPIVMSVLAAWRFFL